MKRVIGIGGIFFKAKNPEKLQKWYIRHLGFPADKNGYVKFKIGDKSKRRGYLVWAPFPRETQYFKPSQAPFMINYRVENLERVLRELRREKVKVEDRVEESDYGRFAWLMDPEGNRIELWEPPAA